MKTMAVLFWIGLVVLFYTYLGYPLLLMLLNRFKAGRSQSTFDKKGRLPPVTLLIAAYNEEKVIKEKIINALRLEYPENLLEIWIASDGSSDRTNDIVREFIGKNNRLHLLELPRMGKAEVINMSMAQLRTEIVVFSDANTEFSPDALKKLVMHFSDTGTGCVCGRLIYRNPGDIMSGKGESFYWRYETALKKMESKLGYIAGANGAIYAIRRELFEPLPPGTINDDFMISMQIVKKGYKSIYEEEATAYEDVAPSVETEFRRHIRDGAGHYIAFYYLMPLLNPLLGTRAFTYWSHRILRWSAPFILIILFILNLMLVDYGFYGLIFALHAGFYVFAVFGMVTVKAKGLPFFMHVPFYFCNLNFALLLGFIKAISGKQKMTWERTERAV